ncbi:permease [Intrasporangium chromatireducens Q5-1]|uniref:Permease n=1 Tax=Intrasporangium chromatireducens Q5-1 TaxID=584657 RepID=W9GQ22_9MICO|nr:DMT family transporter [Intrasporangium chromatireducens]EWT05979.1 permease [Intrasporangium chromatireducens Q5-1]
MKAPTRRNVATLLLIALTAVWGSTFFLIRDLVVHVPPVDFLAVRFTLAAVIMLGVFWRPVRSLTRRQVLAGVGLGVLYGLAQILQTQGLASTSASVSGFITGTYVVLTPVFTAVILRERVASTTWAAVGLATAGLALLSLNGFSIGVGEAITLLAAAFYALHIVGLGRWSGHEIATGLSVVQMVVIAVICLAGALPGGITMPSGTGQWASVLYMVVFASIGALWIQTWAQAHMPATRAAIIMTMEPVFAAFFAVALGGEALTVRMLVGGALVVTAMYAVELLARRRPGELPAETLHHEV